MMPKAGIVGLFCYFRWHPRLLLKTMKHHDSKSKAKLLSLSIFTMHLVLFAAAPSPIDPVTMNCKRTNSIK